jgi:hypothetical protein
MQKQEPGQLGFHGYKKRKQLSHCKTTTPTQHLESISFIAVVLSVLKNLT